ncbi:hypothetical protein [Streptomyces sp. NPDC050355]|uniref:hypothetical protein n=1 Tax=Streptomyces sp. NPDC050355 TaxID=3365609 RepID=UPI00378B60EF
MSRPAGSTLGADFGGAGRLVPAEPDPPGSRYVVDHYESVAATILDAHGAGVDRFVPACHTAGLLLAELHRLAPDGFPDALPPGVDRLRNFLTTGGATPPTLRAAALILTVLGHDRWGMLSTWCERLVHDERRVVSHGAPGLACLVVGPADEGVQFLIGDDLGAAPWYWDIGWLLGELTELRHVLGTPATDPAWTCLESTLLAGYGRDQLAVRRTAVLRIVLHLHDYAAYADWDEAEIGRYKALLTELIDRVREEE